MNEMLIKHEWETW